MSHRMNICKFGLKCTNQFCFRYHTSRKNCPYGSRCRFNPGSGRKRCTYIHPGTGSNGSRPSFPLTSHKGRERKITVIGSHIGSGQKCKYGAQCTNQFCWREHDERKECPYGYHCRYVGSSTKKCTYLHPHNPLVPKISTRGSSIYTTKVKGEEEEETKKEKFFKYSPITPKKPKTYSTSGFVTSSKSSFTGFVTSSKSSFTAEIQQIKREIKRFELETITLKGEIQEARNLVYLKKKKNSLEGKKQQLDLYRRFLREGDISNSRVLSLEEGHPYVKREVARFSARLPILGYRQSIFSDDYDVLIYQGTTGSGKSTQIGQYLLDEEGKDNRVVFTQPRPLVVETLKNRVEEEYMEENYVSSNLEKLTEEDVLSKKLIFTTDKLLLSQIVSGDEGLKNVDVVVVDEAHERSVETDVLLACLRSILEKKGDRKFKVIVSSATMDVDVFYDFFQNSSSNIRVKKVIGRERLYPIRIRYDTIESNFQGDSVVYYTRSISSVLKKRAFKKKRGHVICFLKTPSEVYQVKNNLLADQEIRSEFVILPLTEKTPWMKQMDVFKFSKRNKVILTNEYGETSITIPGIRVVIDSGTIRESFYSEEKSSIVVTDKRISKARASQRSGRAGRTSFGECFRLYTESEYDMFEEFNTPEIMRTYLGLSLLKIKKFGVGNISHFTFVEKPGSNVVKKCVDELVMLGAFDSKTEELTELGEFISRLPYSPVIGKILYEGLNRGIPRLAVTAVSYLLVCTTESLFESKMGKVDLTET